MKKISYLLTVLLAIFLFTANGANANFDLPQIGTINSEPDFAEFSNDGKTILTSQQDKMASKVEIWNANTGSLISQLSTSLIYAKAFYSKDNTNIFIGGFYDSPTSSEYDGIQILQYDTKTGKQTKELVNYSGENVSIVQNIIFNKDETIAYVLNNNSTVFLFNLKTGELIDKVVYDSDVTEIGYNEKEDHLLVIYKKQVNILDGKTAEYIKNVTIESLTNRSIKISFSPDFTEAYLVGNDIGLIILDLKDSYEVIKLGELEYPESDSYAYFVDLTISPDGKYLVVSSMYEISVYNTETRSKVTSFNINDYWSHVSFNKNGTRLLAGTAILDATVFEQNELKEIGIQGESDIVLLDSEVSFEAVGINNKDELVEIDQSDVEWSVHDEDVLQPYYGSFYGNKEGITTLTATYNGFETTVDIFVTEAFSDVPTTHTNFEAITHMRMMGIINGYEDSTFRPNNPIPRHHVAAMVGRSGIDLPVTRAAKSFADVPSSHSNYANIQKLYQAGILDGNGNKFNPNNNITHIQLAKILTNIFGFEKADSKNYTFKDIKETHWGKSFAEIMVSNGIMPVSNNTFGADKPVSRAQFAQYFYNSLVAAQ